MRTSKGICPDMIMNRIVCSFEIMFMNKIVCLWVVYARSYSGLGVVSAMMCRPAGI